MRRFISFLLVLFILLSIFPAGVHAESDMLYKSLELEINWNHIKSVGKQAAGSQSCACFALAYARTLLDGKVHYYSEYNANTNEYDAIASWSSGSYSGYYPGNKIDAFKRIYSELSGGNPVVVKVKGTRSSHHYVTIVGFENVSSLDSLSASNFLIIDPGVSGYATENLGKVGYDLKYEESNYQVMCDTTSKSVQFTSVSACDHSYSSVGVCNKCGYQFPLKLNTADAGVYKVVKDFTPRTDAPYDAATADTVTIKAGKELNVLGSLTNSFGNKWYKFAYGEGKTGYVYFDRLEFAGYGDQEITCTITSPAEGATVPKASYPVKGTVTSKYPLKKVEAYIDGKLYATVNADGKYTLELQSTAINNDLSFSSLDPGNHALTIKAHDIHHDTPELIIRRNFVTEGSTSAKTYTITLLANGGSFSNASLSITSGKAIGDLPEAEFEDMDFVGWFTKPYGGTQVTASTVPTGDMTLYAHYAYNYGSKVKLEYDTNGGTIPGPVCSDVIDGVNIGRPGESLVVFNKSGTTPGTNTYGKEIAVNAQGQIIGFRDYGDTTQLTVPSGGFILSGQQGWDSEAGVHVGGSEFVRKIMTLDQAYVSLSYETGEVKVFDSYAGYLAETKTCQDYTTFGVLPVPEREGYVFRGWCDSSNNLVTYYSSYSGIYLRAQWDRADQINPEATMEYNGHSYELYDHNVTWKEAKALCESLGGYLVVITDAQEHNAIVSFIQNGTRGMYKMGATDEVTEGTWLWVNGEKFSYNNWGTDYPEPSGAQGEHYANIIAIENPPNKQVGDWVDSTNEFHASSSYDYYYDFSNTGFICEYDRPLVCEHDYYSVVTGPTCTVTGYTTHTCKICGDSYKDTYIEPLGHDLVVGEIIDEAGCLEEGLQQMECTRCDYSEIQLIEAWDHDYTLIVTVPTCTEKGYTTHTCSLCGDSYVDTYVDKLDHSWDTGKVTTAAGCKTEGVKTYTCGRCGETKTEKIPATGHSYTTVITAPTCTEQGYTTHSCSKCGDSYVNTYVDPLNHSWDNGKVTTAAGCETDGVKTYTCGRCGETKTEKIPATGHSYTAVVTAPTCTEKGYTTHSCSKCGDSYVNTYVDPLNHSWDSGKITTAAGCEAEGVKTYTCSRCGETKTEKIPATGHDYLNGSCKNCGEKDPDAGETIVASGMFGANKNNLTWTLFTDGLLHISGTGNMESFGGAAYTPWANYLDAITHVIIDEGVTSIGEYAFSRTPALTSVTIPSSVKSIGGRAFLEATALTECVLPEGITVIASGTFEGASALKSVYIPESVATIEDEAFYHADSLENCDLPETLTTIGVSAFSNSGLMEVIIPDSVITVNSHAFFRCPNLKNIQFGKNVTKYGSSVFAECTSLISVQIPEYMCYIGVRMFEDCTALEQVTIADGVTTIKNYAFSGCSSLQTVQMADSITTFGTHIFYDCQELNGIVLSKCLTALPENCFNNCDALTEIIIPASVAEIGSAVFASCNNLNRVTFCGNAPTMNDPSLESSRIFYKVTATVFYPDGNETWKPSLMHSYGGNLTWVPYGEKDYSITYTQASISLAGDIGLNYYATLSEDLMADEGAYMIFTVAGEEQIVPISEAIISTGKNGELVYRFSCAVPARMMSELVVGQMYASDGTAVGEAKAFSVKAYCDKAIAAYGSYASYANLVNLMKAMLNYGGYSQIKFGYNTGNLANADLEDKSLPNITAADLAGFAHGKEGAEAGINIQSVSLLLESTTTIRFYFKLDGSKPIESYTFVVDGEVVEPVHYSGTTYYVDKVGVPARELDVNSYVEVGGLRVWYCGMSYVRQILNSSTDTELINACKALYAYSEAANSYFK